MWGKSGATHCWAPTRRGAARAGDLPHARARRDRGGVARGLHRRRRGRAGRPRRRASRGCATPAARPARSRRGGRASRTPSRSRASWAGAGSGSPPASGSSRRRGGSSRSSAPRGSSRSASAARSGAWTRRVSDPRRGEGSTRYLRARLQSCRAGADPERGRHRPERHRRPLRRPRHPVHSAARAPVTLVVKDRVTGHNPVAVLYGQPFYYRRLVKARIEIPGEGGAE